MTQPAFADLRVDTLRFCTVGAVPRDHSDHLGRPRSGTSPCALECRVERPAGSARLDIDGLPTWAAEIDTLDGGQIRRTVFSA